MPRTLAKRLKMYKFCIKSNYIYLDNIIYLDKIIFSALAEVYTGIYSLWELSRLYQLPSWIVYKCQAYCPLSDKPITQYTHSWRGRLPLSACTNTLWHQYFI